MAKIKGLRQFIQSTSKKAAAAAAREVVDDLKQQGPYYTGHFEESWVVVPGAVNVPATSEHPLSPRDRWQGWEGGDFPDNRRQTPVDIPEGHSTLTIGNRAKYRDIAMDLLPGRYEVDKNNTADKDWFVRYVQAGGLKAAVQRGIRKAEKSKM